MLLKTITLFLVLQTSAAFGNFPKTSNWDPQGVERILMSLEQGAKRIRLAEATLPDESLQAFVESVELMKLQVERYPHSSTYTEYDLKRLLQAYEKTGTRRLNTQIQQLKRHYQ